MPVKLTKKARPQITCNFLLDNGKCPKFSKTIPYFFQSKSCFFMQLFLKLLSGMANSEDPAILSDSLMYKISGFIVLLVKFRVFRTCCSLERSRISIVNVLKFHTKCLAKWHIQTVQTQIRLLHQEQSDQGLHCWPFYYM